MSLERVLSGVAFLFLVAFLFILVWRVPRLDLGLAIFAALILCGYDLFLHRNVRRA